MGPEKIVGYPLALLGSFALFAQPPSSVGGLGGAEGAGGNLRVQPAADHQRPDQRPAAAVPASTISPPAIAAPPGRPSAESAELRALRMDEGSLFPEYGQPRLDLHGAIPTPPSCENPDYELAKSVEAEIPSAGDWLRGLKRPDIAVPRDPKVARYIRYFASTPRGRETFAAWLRRSGSYRDIITAALNRRHLPIDLMAVMFVESGCWPKATSSAGAAGLWQFMPQTARAYGLTVQADYDERRNIWKSTEAALTHLSDLHNQFESWHLALAAYNVGYQQLLNRLQSTRTEDFFSLSRIPEALPRETALYVPKILAVALILRNLEYFGFDGVEMTTSLSASRIEVPPNTRMTLLARASGTSVKKLRELNPQILGDSVPDIGSPVFVHLPNSGLARAKTMLPRLLEQGDRGSLDLNVASDFDWGRDEMDANWRSRLDRTKPGAAAEIESSTSERKPKDTDRERPIREPKTREESVTQAPERNDDTAEQEERIPVVNGTSIEPNSKSRHRSSRREKAAHRAAAAASDQNDPREELAYRGEHRPASQKCPNFYRIKPGDTLSELAASFKVPWQQLAEANGLSDPSRILAGSRIRVAANLTNGKR